MKMTCKAFCDNPDERNKLVERLRYLKFYPRIEGNSVVVDFVSYNTVKADVLVSIFENYHRHEITCDNHDTKGG